MKFLFLLILLFIAILAFPQIKTQAFEPLDLEKVSADIDTIKQQMDSTAYYIKATCDILVLECKEFGLVKTIRLNSGIFLPVLVIVGLFLVWLRGREIAFKQ